MTATALDVCAFILGEAGLDPRLDDRSRCARSQSFARYRSHRQLARFPAHLGDRSDCSRSHAILSCSCDRSRSRGRQPASSARSRAGENGRLARRDQQEGAEAVFSQPPAVSEVSIAVTPAAGAAALSALPSAVQDLARFFLSLSGFYSLGAVGGVAGMAAPTVGSGFSCGFRLLQLVQSHLVLRLRYLLELVILLLPAAVPGVLGFSSVRWIPALAGVVVTRPAVGLTDGRRSVTGGGLLHLCFLLVVRRSTIGLPRFSRLWIRFSSAHFWSLLHWRRLSGVLPASALTAVSLAFGLAFVVFCGSGGFPRGY